MDIMMVILRLIELVLMVIIGRLLHAKVTILPTISTLILIIASEHGRVMVEPVQVLSQSVARKKAPAVVLSMTTTSQSPVQEVFLMRAQQTATLCQIQVLTVSLR
jgi:hypothetical protein